MNAITQEQLAIDIERFLLFKRALGYRYYRSEATLREFQRFVGQRWPNHSKVVEKINVKRAIHAWLSHLKNCKPVTVSQYLGIVRQLCLYQKRFNPNAFVPECALAPQTESTYIPYIFSVDEVKKILTAAKLHRGRNIWSTMLYTLILILYCTGVRFGEAVRLCLSDIDLRKRVFFIRESKGRSRFVPFGKDLAKEINKYINERQIILTNVSTHAEPSELFIRLDGTPLNLRRASDAVRCLLRRLDMKPSKGRLGPRPYDFRHAYAVHRLTDWYKRGIDVHARLPWLSAYMGHVNMLGTEDYLHATPELMRIASERFEKQSHQTRSRS